MKRILILCLILISQSAVAMDLDSQDGREVAAAAYAQCIEILINEYDAKADVVVPICTCMVDKIVENMSQFEIYEMRNNGNEQIKKKFRVLREQAAIKCREPFNDLLQGGKK